jgi:hypothetical protein
MQKQRIPQPCTPVLKQNKIQKITEEVYELEVYDLGLKIEAERDETLSQYFENVLLRHQSSFLGLRHPVFYKSHEIRATLVWRVRKQKFRNLLTPLLRLCCLIF